MGTELSEAITTGRLCWTIPKLVGGRGETDNGGTVKVFHTGSAPNLPDITAGRLLVQEIGPLTGVFLD